MEVPGSLEITNDDADPESTDLANFNLTESDPDEHDPLGSQVAYLRAMRAAGVETFIGTVWSPPKWMKHNRANGNGTAHNSAPPFTREPDARSNQLRADLYAEFAEFCVAYVRLLEREAGIELFAISLQNEPRFSQWYVSAVYDGPALAELVRVVGARFAREGIGTRIFLPEDAGDFAEARKLSEPSLEDPLALSYLAALAVHGYARDGERPGSSEPESWAAMARWAADHGLPLWMTEASGYRHDWSGALRLASNVHAALRFGNSSVWNYYKLGESEPDSDALIRGGESEPSPLYHAARHFYRFIRPGAVRVGSSSSDPELLAVAFDHTDGFVLVLVNQRDESVRVELTGSPLPETAERLESTASARGVEHGSQLLADSLLLPARSLTTLMARDPRRGKLPPDEEAPRASLARGHGLERRGGTTAR